MRSSNLGSKWDAIMTTGDLMTRDEDLQNHLIPLLKAQNCNAYATDANRDAAPVSYFIGSAGGRISLETFPSGDEGVRIIIPIVTGAEIPDDDLISLGNNYLPYGSLIYGFRDDGTANLALIKSMLLQCGYEAIAREAALMLSYVDNIDDGFQERFGGTRNSDSDAQPASLASRFLKRK